MSDALRVTAKFDEDAGVWHVSSPDVPGLHLEVASLDGMWEVMADALPDLLADPRVTLKPGPTLRVLLSAEGQVRVAA